MDAAEEPDGALPFVPKPGVKAAKALPVVALGAVRLTPVNSAGADRLVPVAAVGTARLDPVPRAGAAKAFPLPATGSLMVVNPAVGVRVTEVTRPAAPTVALTVPFAAEYTAPPPETEAVTISASLPAPPENATLLKVGGCEDAPTKLRTKSNVQPFNLPKLVPGEISRTVTTL